MWSWSAKAVGFRHTEYVGRSCSMKLARRVTSALTTLHVGSGLAVCAESGSECHARWVIQGGMYPPHGRSANEVTGQCHHRYTTVCVYTHTLYYCSRVALDSIYAIDL